TRAARRAASGTPRVWMPTIARCPLSAWRSTTSCAIRATVLRNCSASTRTLVAMATCPSRARPCGTDTAYVFAPFRPRRAELKVVGGEPTRIARRGDTCPPADPAIAAAVHHRAAALGERQLDLVEVAGHDHVGERLLGLTPRLARERPAGEVREGQKLDAGARRQLRGFARGGGPGLDRALGLVLQEGRLVHEQRRPGRGGLGAGAGARVARQHDRPAGPLRAEHLPGPDLAAVGQGDGLAALEAPVERPLRDAERARGR